MRAIHLLILAVAALVTPSLRAQTIYGVTSADSTTYLYSIDSATGAASQIGTGIGFDMVSSIDFDQNGTLYGYSNSSNQLITINLTTGAGTAVVVSPNSFSQSYTDMTFTSSGAVLYGQAKGNLYTLDRVTGAEILVGNNGTNGPGNAAAISPGGTLFFAVGADNFNTNFSLYEESTSNGSLTLGARTMNTQPHPDVSTDIHGWRLTAMDFDPVTGNLWGIFIPSSSHAYLVQIDTATGQLLPAFSGAYFVPTTAGMDAIAIAPVPEPAASSVVIGLMFLGWACLRRRAEA